MMTAKQAAEYMQCNIRRVHWLLETGQIKGGKVANQWRTYQTEIDKFVLGGGETVNRSQFARSKVIPARTRAGHVKVV